MQKEDWLTQIEGGESRPGILRSILLILLGSFVPVILLLFELPAQITLMFASILIFLPAYIYVKYNKYSVRTVFKLAPITWQCALASVLIGLCSPIISDELGVLVQLIITVPAEWHELAVKPFLAASVLDWFVIITGVVLIAPAIEELLFRGMLQGAFEVRLEWWQAVLQTALIFALLHLLDFMMIQYFLLGVLLGFVCWRSRSVLPAILVHMVYNAVEVISINLTPDALPWYTWNGHVNPTVLALASCIMFYSLRWFYKLTEA
jgi:membrane protease YdiL (CAAX protease family)